MLWKVRFSHRRSSAPSPPHHGPPSPAPRQQFSLPLPGFCCWGEQGLGQGGGLKGQGKDGEPWSAGGRCLRGISRSAIDFPLSASRNMYGAEILINPHSAAHRSAAAQGLLSKGSWGCKRGAAELGKARTDSTCLYPLLPYPKGNGAAGKPGQHPSTSSIPVGHPPGRSPAEILLTLPSPVRMPQGAPFLAAAGWPRSIPTMGTLNSEVCSTH